MTEDEIKSIQDTLSGMIGKKYLFDDVDVVTIENIFVKGDVVTIETDVWTDGFDMSGFDDWGGKFVQTRRKSEVIAGLEASIMEKTDMIVARDTEIADLKKQLMVMRNVVNSPSPLKPQPQPEAKPAGNRHESVYPRVFELLFDTAAGVIAGTINTKQADEIRQLCQLVAGVSEVQSKVISFSRKPAERKFEAIKR